MNRRRLLLGGLVAGLLYTVGGYLLGHVVLDSEFQSLMESVGAPEGTAVMPIVAVATRLAFGLITVFLYAAVRPRLGPGPRTAGAVALVVWFLLYGPYLEALAFLGLFPGATLWTIGGWGLLETSIAALAGAWVYREEGGAAWPTT